MKQQKSESASFPLIKQLRSTLTPLNTPFYKCTKPPVGQMTSVSGKSIARLDTPGLPDWHILCQIPEILHFFGLLEGEG
jgi:hypothetical protein